MSTIKDVAKYTGLSIATISKYLNGGNVLEENRVRIAEAIQVLDYKVNRAARSLKTNRSMTVGVLLPTIDSPFFSRIVSRMDTCFNRPTTIPLFAAIISTGSWSSKSSVSSWTQASTGWCWYPKPFMKRIFTNFGS